MRSSVPCRYRTRQAASTRGRPAPGTGRAWGRRRRAPEGACARRRGLPWGRARQGSAGGRMPRGRNAGTPRTVWTEGTVSLIAPRGKVAEWSIAPHSKCGIRATVSGVRIPPFPPASGLATFPDENNGRLSATARNRLAGRKIKSRRRVGRCWTLAFPSARRGARAGRGPAQLSCSTSIGTGTSLEPTSRRERRGVEAAEAAVSGFHPAARRRLDPVGRLCPAAGQPRHEHVPGGNSVGRNEGGGGGLPAGDLRQGRPGAEPDRRRGVGRPLTGVPSVDRTGGRDPASPSKGCQRACARVVGARRRDVRVGPTNARQRASYRPTVGRAVSRRLGRPSG